MYLICCKPACISVSFDSIEIFIITWTNIIFIIIIIIGYHCYYIYNNNNNFIDQLFK